MGLDGAMVQMVSHGLISGALFLCVGVLYDRVHSRQIADYGGVINTMPVFAAFMVLFALANTGLPGTSGFVGSSWSSSPASAPASGTPFWRRPRWCWEPPTRCGSSSAWCLAR